MPSKVILHVSKGEQKGKEFLFDRKEQLFMGRQEDCIINLTDKTVSRYHCMLEITPPEVTVRDFGSLNGTFLNGEKIGQRESSTSIKEAQKEYHEEFELHDGDILGLGKHCEITMHTIVAKCCAICATELLEEAHDINKQSNDPPSFYINDKNEQICVNCHDKLEAAKNRKKVIDRQQATKQKKCIGCGVLFIQKDVDNNVCPKCATDSNVLVKGILSQALTPASKSSSKERKPKTIKGFAKLSRLGAGGMGEVWLVQEESTGKRYALKTMLPQMAVNKLAKETFLREAVLGESLEHNNVITVYKTGVESDVFYILMEYCEGGSVDHYMEKNGGRLPLDVATGIIVQVLNGLEYAHHANVRVKCELGLIDAQGVVHRDFKPGNIFLANNDKYPIAKVADFGLAKAFETAGLSNHTRTGIMAGTPEFQPRQQIKDFRFSKPSVDVWAAAASYYCMLTGCLPKNVKPGADRWISMLIERSVPIRQRDPAIPKGIAAVIDKALLEVPDIGFSSAKAFKDELIAAFPNDIETDLKEVI